MIRRPAHESGYVVARWWRSRRHRKEEGGQRLHFYDYGTIQDEPFVYPSEEAAQKQAASMIEYNDDDEVVIRALRVRSERDRRRRAWLLGGAAAFDAAAAMLGRFGNINGDPLMSQYCRSMEKAFVDEANQL